MTNDARCRRCGEAFPASLDPGEFEGICPACLAGLATQPDPLPSGGPGQDPPPLKIGATFRNLEILELVGQGGMGVVYKARQIELGRVVALKILSPRLAADPEFARRFTREAQALATLDHPAIVRVHDVGREGDLCYLVMEFVDGDTLRELLAGRRLTADQALRLIPQLCQALEYAHSRGVIHRDVKPENILIARDGAAKIADFGLAKIVSDDLAVSTLTRTDVVMGTVNYMAPEQREGRREADHRADIYSLGVVFYELLTGELPVGRFDPPSRKTPVDGRLDEVVLRALEKDPARRYQRAGELGRDLERVAGGPGLPPDDCPVLDLGAKKPLGRAPGRRFGVHAVACPVHVEGWDRPEIGVKVDGDFQYKEDAARLQSQVDTRRIQVFLPVGARLELAVEEGDATLMNVLGSVRARIADGNVDVVDHDGPLTVDAARADINGLRSEDIDIRVRTEDLSVWGLAMSRGNARIAAEGGALDLRVEPESSFRYTLETAHGPIEGGPATGQVGSGAGTLFARAATGVSVELPSPVIRGIRDFAAKVTKSDIERIGVYLIVNTGLFLFFGLVVGTVAPAVIVAVFWGMALALELWKSYIRGTPGRSLTEAVPGLVRKAMNLVPTPAPAPPPPPKPARTSALAVLGLLFALPGALAAAGAAICLVVARSPVFDLDPPDAGFTMTFAALLGTIAFAAGAIAILFGLTASAHVQEGRGALKGRGLAQATVTLAVASLLVSWIWVRPVLREDQAEADGVRETVTAFFEKLRRRRWDEARELVSAAGQAGPGELEKLGEKLLSQAKGERWMSDGRVRFSAKRQAARMSCSFYTSRASLYFELPLVREGGAWKIGDLADLRREFGGSR